MIRLTIGMIVGAVAAILAADGPATADRIMLNATTLMDQAAGKPDYLLMILSGWGVMAVSLSYRKRCRKSLKKSKYAFLLR